MSLGSAMSLQQIGVNGDKQIENQMRGFEA